MAITYRPSAGNGISQVNVSAQGLLYGKSLGNNLIKSINTPTTPFQIIDTSLISTSALSPGEQDSTWFFKPVTNMDAITSSSIYRCMYIGVEPDYAGQPDFSEVISYITSTVSNSAPTTYPSTMTQAEATAYINNSVSIELWLEGTYNILSSSNTLQISDEFDTTNALGTAILNSGGYWTNVLPVNITLIPGIYLKIWIKISVAQNNNLINFGGFTYTYNIGDLSIANIQFVPGRLNIANIYAGNLSSDNNSILLNQLLPLQFEYNSILSVIEYNSYSNVFFLDINNELNVMSIRPDLDINANKYIEYNLSGLTSGITGNNSYAFAHVIECLQSGQTQSMNVVNNSLQQWLGLKTIVGIFLTESDRNDGFIFFNELVTNSDTDYQQKYGISLYNWNFGVCRFNLSLSNEAQFATIQPGLQNIFNINILDTSTIYILKPNHFATSVIQQDDLYTSLGFDIEDCRINQKKSYLTNIWEKDIVLPITENFSDGSSITYVKTYSSLLPQDPNNQVQTIQNQADNDAFLQFDTIASVDTTNTYDVRVSSVLDDNTPYLKMPSAHEKSVDISNSSVSYDIVNCVDEFSTTIGLSIDQSSLVSSTPTSATDEVLYSITYPSHNHLLNQSDFNNYNDPSLIYQNVNITYYEQVSTRNDGLLTTLFSTNSDLVPITGSSSESLSIYLNKILPPSDITSYEQNFANIVKVSGDGNTALIIAKNVIEVDIYNNPLYSFPTSRAYIYKRCSGTWIQALELKPKTIPGFTFNRFFSILNTDQVDISHDGTSVVISSQASTQSVGTSGAQYSYNGFAVYYFNTTTDWLSYNQTYIPTTLAMNSEQRSAVPNELAFGYSACLSDDGSKIIVGSPSEVYDYVQTDAHGAILNQYTVEESGAIYIFTTQPVSPIGPAASGQDLVYGSPISGAGIDVPVYFLQRIIPDDAFDITVNGITPDCSTNGTYQGKRFGEKVCANTDGTIIAVGAKNDSSQGLDSGAVYTIQTPVNNCVLTVPNKFIKVLPALGYAGQQFSVWSIDLSRDGDTLVVGDGNYNNGEGRAHVFDIDWFGKYNSPYNEVILPYSGFDDITLTALPRNYGQVVKVSDNGSVIFVKDTYSIRGYSSTGTRGSIARTFTYNSKIIEWDKVEINDPLSTLSGETLDLNGVGDVLIVGFMKQSAVQQDRVFIQDFNPGNYDSYTSSSCSTISGSNHSIPVPYLIDVEEVPQTYVQAEVVGQNMPLTMIGDEVQNFVYNNVFSQIFSIHCNGDPTNTALITYYNFYSATWQLQYLNNMGQTVLSNFSSNVKLSPHFPNAITINTFRKQVNGYYCGKRYMLMYDIYVNGLFLYSGHTYTFDTTNSYVVSVNPNGDFTGSLTYWDVREYLRDPFHYNQVMFSVIANTMWGELENEIVNIGDNAENFETFIYRRNILFHNLTWEGKDDIVIPIVLQGNGYNVGAQYSSNLTRSQFDFSNIDVSTLSFGFTYEGSNEVLKWSAWNYDYNKDQQVIWVRLENWQGQRLIMYYGDTSLIKPVPINNVWECYYGAWLMDTFITQPALRYTNINIFNGGEALVLGQNENYYLNQIDKLYTYGNVDIYKSNKFDVYYNDINVDNAREQNVNNFIATNVKLFAPGFMEIRNISSSDPANIESSQVDT